MNRRRFFGAVAAATVGTLGVMHAWRRRQLPDLSAARPLRIQPLPLTPFPVEKARVEAAISLSAPCQRLTYPQVVHALRTWGNRNDWNRAHCFSGRTLLQIVLDQRTAATFFPGITLLAQNPAGWYHRTTGPQGDGDSHAGYSLSVLAELELPLEHPARSGEQQLRVHDLLRGGLWQFSWDGELEWWATAFARYLPSDVRWYNCQNEEVTLCTITERLCDKALGNGECFGTHPLLALVTLLRLDQEMSFLPSRTLGRLENSLRTASTKLQRSQNRAGLWTADWHLGHLTKSLSSANQQLVITGHHLEWLAWCPQEFRPSSHIVCDSINGLIELILQEATGFARNLSYSPLTHAARALRLWQGQNPAWGG